MAAEHERMVSPTSHEGPPSVAWRPIAVVGLFVVVAAAIGVIGWRGEPEVSSARAADTIAAGDEDATDAHDHPEAHDEHATSEAAHASEHSVDAAAAHGAHGADHEDDAHGHEARSSGEHDDAHDHAADASHPADMHDGGGHHHADCTAPVTPEQQQAADSIAAQTAAAIAPYAELSVAKAAGWTNITPEGRPIVHYALWARIADGRVLDPSVPESLVYGFAPDGTPYLLGAMFLMEGSGTPPQPGGCLMQWHAHENLCIEPGKGMVGVVGPDGQCPPGSTNVVTDAMLHAWIVPVPDGPFSDPSPDQLRAAVIAHYFG
jgi:hypothetical protein